MSALLRLFAGLCLIRGAVDMLLPEGDTRALIDYALGLMESVFILGALLKLLEGVF